MAFKVIQGHPYWCQQKSRMDCCHNVQQCRHYFRNLRRYSIGKTANSSILTTPPQFDDSNLRNAFEYIEIIYIAGNKSHLLIFLPLIAWVYFVTYVWKSNALSQEVLAENVLWHEWNSHSRSFDHSFCKQSRPTTVRISPYNIAGLISEISDEVAT